MATRSRNRNVTAINTYVDTLSGASTHVTDVESPFEILNPVSGEPLPAAAVAALYADPSALPVDQQAGIAALASVTSRAQPCGSVVHTTADPASAEGLAVTTQLRAAERPAGIAGAKVGGFVAANYDTLQSMQERTPLAVIATCSSASSSCSCCSDRS